MAGSETSTEEAYWRSRASALARQVNCGWWLDRANVVVSASLILCAVTVLLLRTWQPSLLEISHLVGGVTVAMAVAAGVSWFLARPRFISVRDGFIRLDDRLSLHNRLVTADSGAGPWPGRSLDRPGGASPDWRVAAVTLPTLFSLLIVVLAWFVPFPEKEESGPLVVNEPEAWELMEEWKETLEEEDLIEPGSLREIEERLEELREQPREEWFSHSSMEATDTLKESFGRDIQELARDLATVERDLEALRTFSTELSEEGRQMLMEEMEEALKGISSNDLALNEELAKQLQGLDPSKTGTEMLQSLSAEEMKALQEQLGNSSQGLGSMEGLPGLEEMMTMSEMGERYGRGGITRGRGDAPIFYGEEQDLDTNRIESVSGEDRSRATVGDLIGTGETEHEEVNTPASATAGGTVSSSGKGGEAVWRETLLPDEKALLKRYFP